MNNMQAVQKLNERELELGISAEASWHAKYRDSAWVYVGGLATELTEGDIICVLSQWGEVEDFNYPRDKKTGKPRGWCWCKYEDQRSTILAVDNMNGAKLLRRTLRVDHCEKYKLPPELRDKEEAAEDHYGPAPTSKFAPGAAYVGKDLASSATLDRGVDVYAPSASAAPDPAADGWRQVSSEQAVARAAADAKKAKKDAKREKKESKKDSKKKKSKKESRKRPRDDDSGGAAAGDDDAPLLGYVREALPAPETLPLMPAGKQGEVVAPSWRGAREPGAVSSWSSRRPEKDVGYGGGYGGGKKRSEGPDRPPRSWADMEKDRNKSYGGMGRRR